VEKMVKVSKLNGMKVITTDAFTIGEVNGAEVDTGLWQITHLHVALTNEITKELGFKKTTSGSFICLSASSYC
jgi:sporulation protein YlmC with PRC-barrel domain